VERQQLGFRFPPRLAQQSLHRVRNGSPKSRLPSPPVSDLTPSCE